MIEKRSKSITKRKNTRVDFTPMVDMNMLLLTFFMFCTTLAKPQILDLAMPVPDLEEQTIADAGDSWTTTLILDENNKLYYYNGIPDYEDHNTLKATTYEEMRSILIDKNKEVYHKIKNLDRKQYTETQYKEAIKEIKRYKTAEVVVIKLTEKAMYENLIDILDEMAICHISRYAVVDITEGDHYLLDNYHSKGSLYQHAMAKQ